MKTSKKREKAFDLANKDDRFFIDTTKFDNYKNFVSPLLLLSTMRLIKLTCQMYREDTEGENMDLCKNVLCDVYETYPNVFPRIDSMEKLSYDECKELLDRFSAYFL